MRNHNRKRSCQAPKIPIVNKPEIDRILEEAESHYHKPVSKPSELLKTCDKEKLLLSLFEAYKANLNALQALIGQDSRLRIAKEKIKSCLEDWKEEHELD